MILEKMQVKNFRLLKNFEIYFNSEMSLIIGKNNCGKTSVLVILDKMLNDNTKISWNDINLEHQKSLYNTIKNIDDNSPLESNALEAVTMYLYIKYDDSDSYENIQKFMMDLEVDNNMIILEFVCQITDDKIHALNKIIKEKEIRDFTAFSKYIKKNFSSYFEIKKYSRGFDIEKKEITQEKSEELENKDIAKLIKIDGIRADRDVSNDDKNRVLSKLSEQYFIEMRKLLDDTKRSDINNIFDKLEDATRQADDTLNAAYNGTNDNNGIFSKIFKTIKEYGGVENNINLTVESSISNANLIRHHTDFAYKHNGEYSLPETYNGLGYLNLIGILFEIETKLEIIKTNPADINILYIEESEAHTHPQLQYIFISHIKEHINEYNTDYANKKLNLQSIITSHSAHIVAKSNFDDIIYLKKQDNSIEAKNFSSLERKYSTEQDAFKFVKQYLTLDRCELFFADKAIFIEGDTERILMPAMMEKVDKENNDERKEDNSLPNYTPLLSQKISIVEVGAYSHKFMPFFEFIGIKALIITDIDAVDEKNKKCRVAGATKTSNASINDFFKNIDKTKINFIEYLLNLKSENKVKNNIRITYQIPESESGYCARSFEDAFVSLNREFIKENKENLCKYGTLKQFKENELDNPFDFASKIGKKTAFASTLLYYDIMAEDKIKWKVPKYIKEGLEWLQQD